MKWLREAWRGARDSRSGWLWMLSVFLIGLGARLWLIRRFGTPLPYWDQWAEATGVYVPYFDGKLSIADLFAAHNEHRIFFTRISGLVLLLFNGQWDGQLQLVVNAVMHCATLAGLGLLICRRLEKKHQILGWLPIVMVLGLPFGWENSLAGFQSQFYFLVVFSVLTLWLLGLNPPGSARWWCGVASAFMALFTVGSGFLAAAAVFALVLLRVRRRPAGWRREAVTLAVCGAVVAAGLVLKVDVPHHQPLQAHSAGEFLAALGANLAWPWIVVPPFALLNLLPLALLAWHYFKKAEGTCSAHELTLAIGIWTILQGAAAAYARGAEGKPPGWRHMDSSSLLFIANCFSLAVLLGRHWPAAAPLGSLQFSLLRPTSWLGRFARVGLPTMLILWGLVSVAGLGLLSSRALQIDIPERQLYNRAQLKHARAFMATDDIHVFDHVPKAQLLCYQGDPLAPPLNYEAEWTVQYLRNPQIRAILPACIRLPLEVSANPELNRGFTTNGVRLARPEPPTELSWGSWSTQGAAGSATFESLPIRKSLFPYLEIPVTGDLGVEGLSLELVELATGRRTPVKPCHRPGNQWLACHVKAPTGEFRILARDTSGTAWFAFKPPRELGRLSYWAIEVLAAWKHLLFAGLGLFLLNLVVLWARKPGRDPVQ